MTTLKKDSLFAKPLPQGKDFVFDHEVAAVFDDMIARSVPDYLSVQDKITAVAAQVYRPYTTIYDLGCSTGNTLLRLAREIPDPTVQLVGVDNSRAMLEVCKDKLGTFADRIRLVESDIETLPLDNASVVIMNYTLQFIASELRKSVLAKICAGLVADGALLLTEKIAHSDPLLHRLFIELHYDFKKRRGYSDLEISQKRDSLERVLIPLTADENLSLLHQAGFNYAAIFFQSYNFASFIALKE